MTDDLRALEPPAVIADGHAAYVTQYRDMTALIRQLIRETDVEVRQRATDFCVQIDKTPVQVQDSVTAWEVQVPLVYDPLSAVVSRTSPMAPAGISPKDTASDRVHAPPLPV